MTEQLLWQAFGDQVKLFDARVEPVRRRDAADLSILEEMEQAAPALLRLSTSLRMAQEATRKAALEGRIQAIQQVGEEVDEVLQAAARLSESILKLCHEATDAGHVIVGLKDLERAAGELRGMPDRWRNQWPLIDVGMLEQSAIDHAEGRFQWARDAFHELRSHRAREDQA